MHYIIIMIIADTTTLHTNITPHNKSRLKELGQGSLKDGISRALELLDQKEITVTIITVIPIKPD